MWRKLTGNCTQFQAIWVYDMLKAMVHCCRPIMTLVMVLPLIAGCAQSTHDLYDDYLGRLSNVLNTDRASWQVPPPQSGPRTRELRLDIPDLRVTPVAYWQVRHCGLFRLISDRNSILGRVAPPNAIWRYEARLLAAMEACLQHPDTDESLAEQLVSWQETKRQFWPTATWNGTIAAPEVRSVWQASGDGWAPDSMPTLTGLRRDLGRLAHWADNWPADDIASSSDFSAVYQNLNQQQAGGDWRRSVQISLSGLEAANRMLTQALQDDSLCPSGNRTRDAEHAQNVLMLFFIGEIQPYLSGLNRNGEQLQASFTNLTNAIDVIHPPWERFMSTLAEELNQLQSMSREHAELWQRTLARCEITIGT